jgi:hypothetical protein
MSQNQTEPKPADAEQESGKGLDETACSPSLGTLETECVLKRDKNSMLGILSAPEVFLCTRVSVEDLIARHNQMLTERDEARRIWSVHQDKLAELREHVRLTIMENLHLADGDVCTLKRLKDAISFDLDSPENSQAHPPA